MRVASLFQKLDRVLEEALGMLELRAMSGVGVDQQLRVGNVLRQMPGVDRGDHDVVDAVEHQGRLRDGVQEGIGIRTRQWLEVGGVRLGLGYMPEDRRLVPDLSVRQNILLPLQVAGRRDGDDVLARVLSWIPELKPLIDRQGNQLSGGQQKLAALARAIGYGTKLLLLDEPFEGVAPALVERLVAVLQELRHAGPTILISDSSHVTATAGPGVTTTRLGSARRNLIFASRPIMRSTSRATR